MRSRWGFALCALCLIGGVVGHLAISLWSSPYWVSALIVDSCAAAAAGATLVGARRRTGRARRPWMLLAGGLGLWLVGDLIWDAYAIRDSAAPTLSPADLAYFVAYPMMLVAIWMMLRVRSPRGNREVVLDGLALAAASAVAAWQFLVVPNAYAGMPVSERIVSAAYPLGDIALLMALSWLAFAPGRRTRAAHLLYAFFGITLGLDIAYAIFPRFEATAGWIDLVNSFYPLAYSFLGAAALHHDADAITEPAPVSVARLHPARIAFLTAALLATPLLNLGQHLGERSELLPVGLGLVVTVLVIARFVTVVRDRESAREQLEFQASHDVLTGLLNRHLLTDRIDHAIARGQRGGDSVAVLYVDLDRFKAVNDTHGHEAGDDLLVQAAARLVDSVRTGDTVARLGGDEFAVLCEDVSDRQSVFDIADRIIDQLSEPYELDGLLAVISASVGIAMPEHADATGDELLRDADAAMYRAKEAGRDRWEVFDTAMRDWVERRRETESALAGAVERGELRLVYQPIVDIANGSVAGFEALVRWDRPGHGLVAPLDFIPLAEETGLIVPIGEWVMNEACRQLAIWNETFLDRAPVTLSVNVSGRQLNQASLRDIVERAVHTSSIDPALLTLELTESMLLEDTDWALTQLESVKRLGVHIAIDDFGTGYSALSYLRLFPIDVVKIDRSFIADLGVMAADTTVVAAVIALAHALGHEVVAEGVETAEQLAALTNLGCDFAQGYFFAKPLGSAEATARLRSASQPAAA
jgi:diguanylate cyclase (GGDEF)-like protein